MRIKLFFILAATFGVASIYFLKGTGNGPGWYESIEYTSKLISCAQLNNSSLITLSGKSCSKIGFSYKFRNRPKGPVWIRVVVKSSNYRSGLHILSNGQWHYSYHSGDGTSQILLSRIDNPSSNLEFILTSSETDPEPKPVTFGPIVISAPFETELGSNKFMASSWLRTNDPNKDFWFDRYTSPVHDFTVTMANPGNDIWEHFFGIGVNDATNSGDYFCFPDDKLLILNNRRPTWFYLGALPWKRTVYEDGAKLIVSFKYDGPLHSGGHMRQPHALEILKQNFLMDPLDVPVLVHFSKEYTFDLNQPKMKVRVDAGDISQKMKPVYWIVEDGPYMDFKAADQKNVHSLVNGKEDLQGFYSSLDDKSQLPQVVLYRDHRDPNNSIASTYTSNDARIAFVNDAYLNRYIDQHKEIYEVLQSSKGLSMSARNEKDWFFGIGFDLEKTPVFSFEGHFISGFADKNALREKISKLKK